MDESSTPAPATPAFLTVEAALRPRSLGASSPSVRASARSVELSTASSTQLPTAQPRPSSRSQHHQHHGQAPGSAVTLADARARRTPRSGEFYRQLRDMRLLEREWKIEKSLAAQREREMEAAAKHASDVQLLQQHRRLENEAAMAQRQSLTVAKIVADRKRARDSLQRRQARLDRAVEELHAKERCWGRSSTPGKTDRRERHERTQSPDEIARQFLFDARARTVAFVEPAPPPTESAQAARWRALQEAGRSPSPQA